MPGARFIVYFNCICPVSISLDCRIVTTMKHFITSFHEQIKRVNVFCVCSQVVFHLRHLLRSHGRVLPLDLRSSIAGLVVSDEEADWNDSDCVKNVPDRLFRLVGVDHYWSVKECNSPRRLAFRHSGVGDLRSASRWQECCLLCAFWARERNTKA